MAPQTSGGAAANYRRVRSQGFEQRFSQWQGLAEQMARPVCATAVDTITNILLCFFTEPFEFCDLSLFTGLFQLFDCFYPQFIVQRLNLFWADTGNIQHGHKSVRCGSS